MQTSKESRNHSKIITIITQNFTKQFQKLIILVQRGLKVDIEKFWLTHDSSLLEEAEQSVDNCRD